LIVQKYCAFVEKGPALENLDKMSSMGPSDFAHYFRKQFPQYMEIIEQIDPCFKLIIPGDGPGTASLGAIIQGRDYFSCEPNRIGREAIELDIISSDCDVSSIPRDSKSVLLLFNVASYFDIRPYYDQYERIVVVEDKRDFLGSERYVIVPGTYNSVFVKNVALSISQFSYRLAFSDKLLKNISVDKDIEVSDIKTFSYVRSVTDKIVSQDPELIAMGVRKGEGKKVGLVDSEFTLNLKTRNNISNLKNGRVGNTKKVYGYVNVLDHIPVLCLGDYDYMQYSPPDYEMENVIYQYEVWEGYYLAYIRRPEKVRYVYVEERYKKVLLLGSLEKFDKECRQLYIMIDEYDPYSVTRTLPSIVDIF